MRTIAMAAGWLAAAGLDLRYAARRLRRSPWFTAVAVAYLSVAIATNSAMFSVFHAMVLRGLPFDRPERLVSLAERDALSGQRASLSWLDYLDWRRAATTFSGMGAHAGRLIAITEGEPERVPGRLVSAGLFRVLGVAPQLGRGFGPYDDQPGAPPVVLLSDALWRRRFGGDSTAPGRSLSINGQLHTIVGVMPAGFKYPGISELWTPIAPVLHQAPRSTRGVTVLARLADGVTVSGAAAEVATISRRQHQQYPPPAGARARDWSADVRVLGSRVVGGDERLVATAMLGATLFLLLIACSNLANLLLTRALVRQREIAVRAAIGASRGRIARELLLEALLIAGAACLVALPIAWQALRLFEQAIPPSDPFPYYVRWSLDLPTFLYAAAVSLATGALFGLAPAMLASRGQLQDALKVASPGGGSASRHNRLRHGLVVAQVGLALVLLVGASLFVRTFVGLNRTELGYDPARIMTMRFYLPGTRYDGTAARNRMVEDVLRRVQAQPGVTAATIADLIPLDDEGGSQGEVVPDETAADARGSRVAEYAGVSGRWFAVLDVQPVAGRVFTEQELLDSVPLAVINRVLATRFWPNATALGRRFRFASDSARTWYTVIGVVPDVRTVKLDEDMTTPPTAYLPFRFVPTRDYGLMVRTRAAPGSVVPAAREAIRAADPAVPVFNVWTMDEVKYLSFWMYAVWGTMFAVFGGIALLLAASGVYAVIFYGVTQRTHEIGVRVALGARSSHIVAMVVRQGLALTGLGIVVGLLGALALTRVVESLLIGVSATDPLSFAGVALSLVSVAALAAWLPARRATRVDPLVALRQE